MVPLRRGSGVHCAPGETHSRAPRDSDSCVGRECPRTAIDYNERGENSLAERVTLRWLEASQERVGVVVKKERRAEAVEDMSQQRRAARAALGLAENLVGPVSAFGQRSNMQCVERLEASWRRLVSRRAKAKQLEN
jgi:hypothetical protein